jgi:hypothetical protein
MAGISNQWRKQAGLTEKQHDLGLSCRSGILPGCCPFQQLPAMVTIGFIRAAMKRHLPRPKQLETIKEQLTLGRIATLSLLDFLFGNLHAAKDVNHYLSRMGLKRAITWRQQV